MDSLYVRDGDDVIATLLTQGPWDPNAQYGGAPCALLTAAVEAVPTLVPMRVARLTFDMHRPVPIDRLRVRTEVARQGKRLQLVTATIAAGDAEVARCTALRLRIGDGPEVPSDPLLPVITAPPLPDTIPPESFRARGHSAFTEGMDIRIPGERRATAWYRLTKPVLSDEPDPSPLVRLAMAADFTANSGNYLDQWRWSAINPDLTINLARYPVGEWTAVATRAWYERDGIGHARADLFDLDGFVGTCTTMALVDEVPAPYVG
jgi:hypothetical protein